MIQLFETEVDGTKSIYLHDVVFTRGVPQKSGKCFRVYEVIGHLRLDPAGVIQSVFVLEDRRGEGRGAALINEACRICRQILKLESVGLCVADTNTRAQALYRRLGFVRYCAASYEGYTQFIKQLT